MQGAARIEVRWLDEQAYAGIEDAFGRRDLAAFAEFASRSLARLPSVAAPGLGPRQRAEWNRGAHAVLENFVVGHLEARRHMLGEWADEFITDLAVCLALPDFLPMYELEKMVEGRHVPLSELCRTGSEWVRAMDAAESAMASGAADRSEFRIAWPTEPSLVILGSLDGGLWEDAAAHELSTALLASSNPAQRLLGAQAKVLNAAERLEVESFAAEHRQRPGVQGQVAAALHDLVASARARGHGVLSLAYQ
jgi:hypothetical protein